MAQQQSVGSEFQEINFGFASAEKESADAPELLLNGYLDIKNMTEEALRGSRWLFLGYKGSGKSAIGERLRLLAAGDPMRFVTTAFLEDFPYETLRKEIVGEGEMETRLQSAWAWLLLVNLLGSLRADQAVLAEDADFYRGIDELTRLGFLPATDLRSLVLTSASKQFRIQLPKIAEAITNRTYQAEDVALTQLVAHLRKLVSHFCSEAQHVLVIDGLDEALSRDAAQNESLAALLMAATRLNADFRRWEAPVKIVVLCRVDLFDRLPGANKNKLRRD